MSVSATVLAQTMNEKDRWRRITRFGPEIADKNLRASEPVDLACFQLHTILTRTRNYADAWLSALFGVLDCRGNGGNHSPHSGVKKLIIDHWSISYSD